VVEALEETVIRVGKPFDMVLDTVSSHLAVDTAFSYETRIRRCSTPLLEQGSGADVHNYVIIGAHVSGPEYQTPLWACGVATHPAAPMQTSMWIVAGIKRLCGLNLFQRGHELFWVRFPNSSGELESLRGYAEAGKLHPRLAAVLPLTSEGVQEAFRQLHSRRTQGKIVVQVERE